MGSPKQLRNRHKPNPAFHPTAYSGLRPLPPSGEFER